MKFHLWKDLLWAIKGTEVVIYCPEHKIELDVHTQWGIKDQRFAKVNNSRFIGSLVCPTDSKDFSVENDDLALASRRFFATLESIEFKDVEIVSLDGYQIPIAKAKTPTKDDEYWVEARINDTKKGKQVVVYAGKKGQEDKSQIFIDVENDKITFDQNNIHPSDVFVRLTGEFKSGKKVTLEDSSVDE